MGWFSRKPAPTDYELQEPITVNGQVYTGVFVDEDGRALLGTVEDNGPHGGAWVWPHGGDQAPCAPQGWARKVGQGWHA